LSEFFFVVPALILINSSSKPLLTAILVDIPAVPLCRADYLRSCTNALFKLLYSPAYAVYSMLVTVIAGILRLSCGTLFAS